MDLSAAVSEPFRPPCPFPPQTWALVEGIRGTTTSPTLSLVRKTAKSLRDQSRALSGLAKFIAKRSNRKGAAGGGSGEVGEREGEKGVEPAEGINVFSE